MRIKLKIRQKILLYVLSTSAILYLVAIGYIVTSSQKALLNDAVSNAKINAQLSAKEIEKHFERDLALTRTLAQAFSVYQEMPTKQWQDLYRKMYKPVIEKNEHIYSIWDSWEFKGYVPNYDKDYGRYCITLWREDNQILSQTEERSLTGDPDKYGAFKKGNQEGLWEPYYDEGMQGKGERILMTTVASPIQKDGKYLGLIGLDISLAQLQELVSKIEPVAGSQAYLVSSSGTIAAHRNNDLIYTQLKDLIPSDFSTHSLGKVIKEGQFIGFFGANGTGEQLYTCFAPIHSGNSYSSWSLALTIPVKEITKSADENLYFSLLIGAAGLFILIVVLILIANTLTKPISLITKVLRRLSKGEISNDMLLDLKTGDEIEAMATALNISIDGLNQKSTFAMDIGQGSLKSNFDLLSSEDVLGKSLIDMRNSLKKAKEDETNRIIEDKKLSWANEGFARFADILRQNSDELNTLADEVIRNIVKYLEANQGAIFLKNEDDKAHHFLELISTYAWDRRKYHNLSIEMGEGLVGACAIEKESILLTEIPEDYITIASGLGEANPRSIAIVPLKQDQVVMGVIELASFNTFEPYQMAFLEKIAESIAATISMVKINARTRYLLEQSQQQAEEMQAQEEEMRQNMEELLATQEEMARKEKEMNSTMEAISGIGMIVEYDFKGIILNVNHTICDVLGYKKEELIGQHHSIMFDSKDELDSERYSKFWSNMRNRQPSEGVFKRSTRNNTEITVKGLSYPIFDDDGTPLKVIELSIDVSDIVKKG
jgi:methyl-accepting chemotaxis protein